MQTKTGESDRHHGNGRTPTVWNRLTDIDQTDDLLNCIASSTINNLMTIEKYVNVS
jgi:hypothetical protein